LGTPVDRLRQIIAEIEKHYSYDVLQQGPNKVRELRIPKAELRTLQRRINKNILAPLVFGEAAHGGVRGRSPLSNATKHLGQPCVVNLDVRDFFPSVRHYVVYRMFRRELGFGRDVARLLTRLTTLDAQLPQGAPTSTAVANIVLSVPVDNPIMALAERSGITYTRFVDDITLSGTNPRLLINAVARMLSRRRLLLYRKKSRFHAKPKLKIVSRSQAQEVTGLTVNSAYGPSTPRRYRDGLRAAIHGLRRLGDRQARQVAIRSIRGRIAYVRQFNPGAANRMQLHLDNVVTLWQ
jgi:RNA-directed DNA polymerase